MSPAGSSSARAEWDKKLERNWSAVRFVGMEVRSRDEQHLFRTAIELGALDPDDVRVELYADAVGGLEPSRIPMTPVEGPAGARLNASTWVLCLRRGPRPISRLKSLRPM